MSSIFDPSSLEVTPEQTAAALAGDGAQLIDVREDDEWDGGRIPGALHIGLQDLGANAGRIDTDRPVVFYCHSGSRSAMAAQAFRGIGIDAYSMAGGIQSWAGENRPVTTSDADAAGA